MNPSYQQRPVNDRLEQLELDLRELLTKDLETGTDGYPMPAVLRKTDKTIDDVMALVKRYFPE